jgi:hypothetical protein
MAISFSGSSQSYYSASTPVTAVPLTIACWMNKPATNTAGVIVGTFRNTGSDWYGFYLYASSTAKVNASAANNNVFAEAQSTTSYSANTWHHVCGVYSSNTSRTIYLDGAGSATNTTSLTPTLIDIVSIAAARKSGFVDNYLNGSLAEVAIWNAALTEPEVKSLSAGMSPKLVRPQSLVLYVPLIRSPQDQKAALAFTTQGSPTVATHPRVYLQ